MPLAQRRQVKGWLAVLLGCGITSVLVCAQMGTAHGADAEVAFSGAAETPGRYGGELTLTGDFEIPDGFTCTSAPWDGRDWFGVGTFTWDCAVVLLPVQSDGTFPTVWQGAEFWKGNWPLPTLAVLPNTNGQRSTVFVSGASSVGLSPGVRYHWAIASLTLRQCSTWRCPPASLTVNSVRVQDFLPPVEVPAQVSRQWKTDIDKGTLIIGDSVQFQLKNLVTWSDGLVTAEPYTASVALQFRATGSALWEEAGRGNVITLRPKTPGDFRFLIDGVAQPSVFVHVIRPTSAHRVSNITVSAAQSVANAPLEFTATLDTQYDDQVWRPSPVGTGFELQFLADAGTAWSRLVSGKLTEAGKVQVRWPMLGSGRFRLVAGSAVSETVAVTEVKPTSVVAPDPLNLPVEVFPGEPVDISVGVDVQYSDGVYRDAPDGTPFSVEFAEAFSRTRSNGPSALVWRPVATGSTAGGRANVQVKPRTSGYWRIAFGQTRTAEVYLEVVGSQPGPPTPVTLVPYGTPSESSISWSFTPLPGLTYRASARTASGAIPSSQIVLDSAGLVTVSGLRPATTVIVTVIGTDAYGQSDGGATAQGTTAGGSTQAAIVISGTRTQVRGKPGFVIKGTATGLNAGTTLRPMTRMPGDTGYQLGNVRITPGVDGTFTWKRTSRFKVYVYVATEDGLVASNRVIIPAA